MIKVLCSVEVKYIEHKYFRSRSKLVIDLLPVPSRKIR